MDQFTNHFDVITGDSNGSGRTTARGLMNHVIDVLIKLGILKEDLDYHLIRASMVIIFLFFGYQKWFEYEAQVLIPYRSGHLEHFCSWGSGKKLGIFGALGSSVTFICTVTIIPFMPDGWAASWRNRVRTRLLPGGRWIRTSGSRSRNRHRRAVMRIPRCGKR